MRRMTDARHGRKGAATANGSSLAIDGLEAGRDKVDDNCCGRRNPSNLHPRLQHLLGTQLDAFQIERRRVDGEASVVHKRFDNGSSRLGNP